MATGVGKAAVQSASPYDLIHEVNALRAARGYPPLVIHNALMVAAQGHSNYQMSVRKMTHTGEGGSRPDDRTRAAGYAVVRGGWITENIAGGLKTSASYAVRVQWQDDLHMLPVTTPDMRDVGAGVAVDSNGFVYYTLVAAVVPGSSGIANVSKSAGSVSKAQDTPAPTLAPLSPILTSTPRPDGSVYHEVLPGQFLWNIAQAYGLNVPTLIALNKMAPTPVLYAGEKLLIRPSYTPTPTPRETITRTSTASREATLTRTPTLTNPPTLTATPSNTPTPTQRSLLPDVLGLNLLSNRSALAVGIIVVCALGLIVVMISSLRRK